MTQATFQMHDAAAERPTATRGLALFDFDGTITTHETMPPFVRLTVSRPRLWLGRLLLAPLVAGYRLGWVSGTRIRAVLVRFAYTGVPVATLAAAGRAFADDVLPRALRPEMMARIAWHRAQGHTVVVVSGGLDAYLAPWCARHGLDLVCSTLQQRGGVLTGRYDGAQCVLDEKARRVRERYDVAGAVVYAYGDTPEDFPLLGLATYRVYRGQPVASPG